MCGLCDATGRDARESSQVAWSSGSRGSPSIQVFASVNLDQDPKSLLFRVPLLLTAGSSASRLPRRPLPTCEFPQCHKTVNPAVTEKTDQWFKSTATGDVLHAIVDVRGDDLSGWTRCAYDTGEFVELPQAHLNRLRADLFANSPFGHRSHGSAGVGMRPRVRDRTILSTNSALPLLWNYLTLSDGLLTVYEVA